MSEAEERIKKLEAENKELKDRLAEVESLLAEQKEDPTFLFPTYMEITRSRDWKTFARVAFDSFAIRLDGRQEYKWDVKSRAFEHQRTTISPNAMHPLLLTTTYIQIIIHWSPDDDSKIQALDGGWRKYVRFPEFHGMQRNSIYKNLQAEWEVFNDVDHKFVFLWLTSKQYKANT